MVEKLFLYLVGVEDRQELSEAREGTGRKVTLLVPKPIHLESGGSGVGWGWW